MTSLNERGVLFIDPTSHLISGAQKVTLSCLEALQYDHRVIALIRRKDNKYREAVEKICEETTYLSPEILLNRVFGRSSGSATSLPFKFFKFFNRCLALVFCNIHALILYLKEKPSFVYVYDPAGYLGAAFLISLLRGRIVWHLHGHLPYPEWINRILLNLPFRVIAPSRAIADRYSKIIDISVVYNGIEFSETDRSPLKSVGSRRSLELVFAGILVPQKGLHVLLSALADIETDLCINLAVYGEFQGDLKDEYSDYIFHLVSRLPESVEVIFFGWVDNLNDRLSASDVLIFPSIERGVIKLKGAQYAIQGSEALPTIVIESLGAGTPVIAADVPGVAEIMESPEYGVVLTVLTPQSLKSAIFRVLDGEKFNFDHNVVRERFARQRMQNEFRALVKPLAL